MSFRLMYYNIVRAQPPRRGLRLGRPAAPSRTPPTAICTLHCIMPALTSYYTSCVLREALRASRSAHGAPRALRLPRCAAERNPLETEGTIRGYTIPE